MGNRHGCLCHLRRTFQAGLQRAQGNRPLHPGRRVSARLPASPRGSVAVTELLQEKIRTQDIKSDPAFTEGRRQYPVPEFTGTDLEPPYNPDVWQPPANPNAPAEEEVEEEATA